MNKKERKMKEARLLFLVFCFSACTAMEAKFAIFNKHGNYKHGNYYDEISVADKENIWSRKRTTFFKWNVVKEKFEGQFNRKPYGVVWHGLSAFDGGIFIGKPRVLSQESELLLQQANKRLLDFLVKVLISYEKEGEVSKQEVDDIVAKIKKEDLLPTKITKLPLAFNILDKELLKKIERLFEDKLKWAFEGVNLKYAESVWRFMDDEWRMVGEFVDAKINSIQAVSADEVWVMISPSGEKRRLIKKWDGKKWEQVGLPQAEPERNIVFSVAKDGTPFLLSRTGKQGMLKRWDGKSKAWKALHSVPWQVMANIAAVSKDEIWVLSSTIRGNSTDEDNTLYLSNGEKIMKKESFRGLYPTISAAPGIVLINTSFVDKDKWGLVLKWEE